MPEPLIVQTLTKKRAEILGQIKAYEAQIAHAKHDLAHVNATIELFAAPERQRAWYIVSHGFLRRARSPISASVTLGWMPNCRRGNWPSAS